VNPAELKGNLVSPTVITDGVINLNLGSTGYTTVELVSTAGIPVFKRKIEGQTGRIRITTGALAPGIYMVRLTGQSSTATQKVLVQ